MESTDFCYQPLPNATTIRLLNLHAGSGEGEIRASFELADLNGTHQDYEALSYCWGPPVLCQRLRLEQGYLGITQNLHDALLSLRLPTENRIVWADAVCIDQDSIQEKNKQVRLISKLFGQCSRCTIYLGPEADSSQLLPDLIGVLYGWLARDARSKEQVWRRGHIASFLDQNPGLPSENDPRWDVLRAFLRRPWFRRVWVLQEHVLPKIVIVSCGNWEMNGSDLTLFIHTFSLVIPLGPLFGPPCGTDDQDILSSILLIRKHMQCRFALGHTVAQVSPEHIPAVSSMQNHLNLLDLIDWAYECDTTDPRDRLFGVLGIANDVNDASSLQPDYGKELEEIVQTYISFIVGQGNGARLLRKSATIVGLGPAWPSWYPDWHMKNSKTSKQYESASLSRDVMVLDSKRLKEAVTMMTRAKLSVRGFIVDQIQERTRSTETLTESYKAAFDLCEASNPFMSDEDLKRFALRVLVCNKTHQGNEVSEAFLDACERYVDYEWDVSAFMELGNRKAVFDEIQTRGHVEIALNPAKEGCFGATRGGYYGMFSEKAEIGDDIFMIDGGPETFLVRHQPETDTYVWLRQTYVYNFEDQIEKNATADKLISIVVV